MSTVAMLDSLDTPMLDFTDDTDVQMAGSSNESWLTMHHMDEDSHHHSEHSSVLEVDMGTYEETSTEYEMLDAPPQDEVVDAEVVDVSFHESPQPSLMASVPSTNDTQPVALPTPISWADKSEGNVLIAANLPSTNDVTAETHSAILEPSTVVEPPFVGNVVSKSPFSPKIPQQSSTAVEVIAVSRTISQQPSESHDHSPATGEPPTTNSITKVPVDVQYDGHPQLTEVTETADMPKPVSDGSHEHHSDVAIGLLESTSTDVPATTEDGPATDAPGPEIYVDPPPPIHLSLHIGLAEGDQPDFVLFNLPESSTSSAEEPLVLLQHLPSLYYEPITAVFEAFRNEEYFSHLQELSEAEMAINAFDLQLLISEDNVYAREVSLHDLCAMHYGVGLPGHLRVSLQSVVPRFITRYNQLREQITSLTFAEEPLAEGHTDGSDSRVATGLNQVENGSGPSGRRIRLGSSNKQTSLTQHSDAKVSTPGESATSEHVESVSVPADGPDKKSEADGEGEVDDEKVALPEELDSSVLGSENKVEDALHRTESTQEPDDAENNPSHEPDEDGEVLDADTIHGNSAEADEAVDDEQETEYFDTVAPEADDEEGYADEYVADGAEGTGFTNADDPTAVESRGETSAVDRAGLEEDENDASEEIVHAQLLSASTSHDTNEGDEDADADAEYDGEAYEDEKTNHSRHEEHDALAQGNSYEEDDIGDEEFGEEENLDQDAEGSEEGTLDGSTEDTVTSSTSSTNPLLLGDQLSSSNPVEDLSSSTISKAKETSELSGQDGEELTTKDFPLAHKNASKRSLDEAELEEEESPLDSPGSKRSRVL